MTKKKIIDKLPNPQGRKMVLDYTRIARCADRFAATADSPRRIRETADFRRAREPEKQPGYRNLFGGRADDRQLFCPEPFLCRLQRTFPALVAALTSTEDMRFYSHSGIDFISLARVAVKTMALRQPQSGRRQHDYAAVGQKSLPARYGRLRQPGFEGFQTGDLEAERVDYGRDAGV